MQHLTFAFLLITLVNTPYTTGQCQSSCPLGWFGCQCSQQCTYCGTKALGALTYYDCDDSVTGTGNCRSCPPVFNSVTNHISYYGPQCTRCLQVPAAIDGSGSYKLFGSRGSPLYCNLQYPGTTCGNSPDQLTVCRCLDTTKTFVLPTPIVSKFYDISGWAPGLYIQTWLFDGVAPPDPSTYCCNICLPNQSGCQCQWTCEAGCVQCSTGITPPVCQKCAANYYMVAGKCQPCPSTCSICTAPGCNTANACHDNTGYCTNQCSVGYYGPKCDQACNCVPGSTCLTDGTCSCNQAGTIVSQALFACINPACGLDRVNLCSGHGLCVQSQANPTLFDEYCVCDTGYKGGTCSQPNTKADECDCGVLWSTGVQVSLATLPSMVMLNDLAGVTLFGDQSTRAGFPVGTPEEAKGRVYLDALADGFLMWTSPFYGLQTGQASLFPSPVLMAAPFKLQTGATLPASLPTGITFVMYTIDRSQQNNCTSVTLDLNYFWQQNATNRALVQQYCQDTHNDNVLVHLGKATDRACDTYPNPALAFTGFESPPGFISNYWAIRYWRYMGHQHRLKPNLQCDLSPVVFEPLQYCKSSRCLSLSGVGPPCMLNGLRTGYCLPSSANTYQCKCLEFFDPGNTGVVSLNYKPAWMGLACQFSVATFCINGNDKVLCSGADNACQPKSLWNGAFYLQNFQQFQTPLLQDYLPRCNCDNSAFTGQFCEISRCPNNCKSLSLNAGNCVKQSNSYVCQCTDLAVGVQCEISAAPCLDGGGVKCSGRGICGAPNVNHTLPFCICFEGFFGSICENFYCSPAQMIPGHGTCANGIATGCYAPYSGPACSIDNCAKYGGSVIGQPPSGCQCSAPYQPLFNGATVATCWPQCPTLNGTVCGIEAGVCSQVQVTDSFRSASCSCSQGFVLNQTTGLCDKYCINGDVGPGWTQQSPTPCICAASSGFDIQNGFSPRCDHPICNGFGDYINGQCNCVQPYIGASKCSTNKCSRRGGVVIPWLMGTAQYRCSCPFPYAPLDNTQPFDCDGDLCGSNGVLNPSYGVSTFSLSSACLCKGRYRTVCANSTAACDYCKGTFCLNGGKPDSTDPTKCACVYPFSGSLCELSPCNSTYTASVDATTGRCLCVPGYTGLVCDQAVCLNGGLFADGLCACADGFAGSNCEFVVIPSQPQPTAEIVTTTAGLFGLTQQQAAILVYTGAGVLAFGGALGVVYVVLQSQAVNTVAATAQETRKLIKYSRG